MSDRQAEMTKNASKIIAKKELKLLFKSKRRIFILSITPLMILLIGVIAVIGANSGDNTTDITHVWVINESQSNYTDVLLDYYSVINETEIIDNYQGNYNEIVNSGEFEIVVHIPSNFTSLMQNKESAQISIAYNTNSSIYYEITLGMVELTNIYEENLLAVDNPNIEFDRINPSISTYEEDDQDQGLSEEFASQIFIIPVYIIFFIVIPPISLIMISVTIEREQETLETLFLQPVPRDSIIMGKILYGVGLVVFVLFLDILMIGVDILLFNLFVDENLGGDIADIFEVVKEIIGVQVLLYFLLSIVLLAVLVVGLSVLLSLLAKDEREANLISSIVPLIMFSMIIVVQAVELSTLSFPVQITLIIVPVIGILVALFLELIAGSIGIIGIVGAFAQLLWIAITIRFASRLSESESILELNFQKVASEIKKMILRR